MAEAKHTVCAAPKKEDDMTATAEKTQAEIAADALAGDVAAIDRDLREAGIEPTDETREAYRAAIRAHLSALGRRGGAAKSPRKAAASAANGCKGGRPPLVYRAYDTVTEWRGRPRETVAEAEADAREHDAGCAAQGGYGSAIVVRRDGSRCATLDGEPVWPPHGQSCGAVEWFA